MTATNDELAARLEAREMPAALDDYWLVWSNEHGAWWRANSAGYCTELLGAGLYTREEAERIERDANSHGDRNETAVPLAKKWGAYLGMLTPGTVLHALDRAAASRIKALEEALDAATLLIRKAREAKNGTARDRDGEPLHGFVLDHHDYMALHWTLNDATLGAKP